MWEWMSALVDVPDAAPSAVALVVLDGDDPVGVLPLEIASSPAPARTLGVAGWRWQAPDHVDVVARPGRVTEVAHAMVRRLLPAAGVDVLDLDGLRADGDLAVALGASVRRGLALRNEQIRMPYADIRDGGATVFASKNLRKQIGRGLRIAEQRGGGLQVLTTSAAVTAALPELMSLHNARFGSRSAVYATPARREFHLLAAARLAEVGGTRLYRLWTSDGTAALLHCLVLGPTVFAYQMGMAPELSLSPGRTIYGQAICAAAREGCSEFDMLRGESDYKMRFATDVRNGVRLRVIRPGPRTAAAMGLAVLRRFR